jgi:hypothetical protein
MSGDGTDTLCFRREIFGMASRCFSGILVMDLWAWKKGQALVDTEPKGSRESANKLTIMRYGDSTSTGII